MCNASSSSATNATETSTFVSKARITWESSRAVSRGTIGMFVRAEVDCLAKDAMQSIAAVARRSLDDGSGTSSHLVHGNGHLEEGKG